MSSTDLPKSFRDAEHLEEVMTAPMPPLVEDFKKIDGDIIVLGICGAHPPEGWYVPASQVGTIYYFFHFLILLPVLGKIERPLPLPPSIADAVLTKKVG